MTKPTDFISDFHWMMDVLQFIDVGLVILDKEFNVQLWNAFMQNHSAKDSADVLGQNLFETFPELPEDWFRRKANSVFTLHNSAFTTWEQRPYLFRFDSYRPITSIAEYMYQNSTIIPLKDTNGQVEHICVIVYDVTEVAVNRLQIQAANAELKRLSRTDGLTGLLNRKTWENDLNEEFRHEIDFTVSLGVSELSTSFSEPTHWIDSADKGLYQAKRSGRNNTVIHTGCD